jgi:hypothetical protein
MFRPFWSRKPSRPVSRERRGPRVRPLLEALEDRTLPAVTFSGVALNDVNNDGQNNDGGAALAGADIKAYEDNGTAAGVLTSTTLIRFVPSTGFLGTASLTCRAWDQTSGTAGNKVNIVATGGTSAFSKTALTATLLVNTAPVLA